MPRIFGVSVRIGYENLLESVGATVRLCMVSVIPYLLHGTLRVACCYETLSIAGIYLNFDLFRGLHRDIYIRVSCSSVLVQFGSFVFLCAACGSVLRRKASVLMVVSEIGCNVVHVGCLIATNTQHYLLSRGRLFWKVCHSLHMVFV